MRVHGIWYHMCPFVQFSFDCSCMWLNYVNCLSVNIHCRWFGTDLPHLGRYFKSVGSTQQCVCVRVGWGAERGSVRGVWGGEWGGGSGWVGVGLELCYDIPDDMMLRDMMGHDIGIVDILWPTELSDNWPVHVWAPASPHTDPTLRSAEAPLSSLREGLHGGRPASCHVPVQTLHWYMNSMNLCGWNYCTYYWLVHVQAPSSPSAWPVPWECGLVTFQRMFLSMLKF